MAETLTITLSEERVDEIIDELTYRSYAHNRRMFPQTTPEQWAVIFPNVPAMEARFQVVR